MSIIMNEHLIDDLTSSRQVFCFANLIRFSCTDLCEKKLKVIASGNVCKIKFVYFKY